MPFTPTHAAAVLPFLRTPLPASALVIGSMAPDVPFYLPFDPGLRTHTAWAIGTTDLLFGALVWVTWHGLLAAPALWAAPRGLRARLAEVPLGVRPRLPDLRAAVVTVLALAVGSATHVFLDEFTHVGREGPRVIPALAEMWGPMPGYRWLQHGGTLVGGLILLVWFALWWRRTPVRRAPGDRAPRWPWLLIVGVGAAVGGTAAVDSPDLGAAGYDGATWGGGAAAAVAVLLALLWHLRHRGVLPHENGSSPTTGGEGGPVSIRDPDQQPFSR
jgi:Domain of unknown function (DUF4184)